MQQVQPHFFGQDRLTQDRLGRSRLYSGRFGMSVGLSRPFSLALCLLGSLFFNSLANGAKPAAANETKLRNVTFNAEILTAPFIRAGSLQKYRFHLARQAQFERVAALIETLDPDILNLVEVTSQEGVALLIKILHEKGMTDYQGYHVESNDKFTGMDVALISKIKPDKINGKQITTLYSSYEDPTWRESYRYVTKKGASRNTSTSVSRNSLYFLTVAGHKLGFLGLHLKSNPDNEKANGMRTAQAKLVQRMIRSQIIAQGYQPVVLGDLNDYDPEVPDRDPKRSTRTAVLRTIKNYDPKRPGDELVNVAAGIVRQADRYTSHWDLNENGAADETDVLTMIDHILLPKELMQYVRRVHISHTVSLETSDHFPVVVDLVFPTGE